MTFRGNSRTVISRNCRQFLVDFFFCFVWRWRWNRYYKLGQGWKRFFGSYRNYITQQIIFNGRISQRNCFEAFENGAIKQLCCALMICAYAWKCPSVSGRKKVNAICDVRHKRLDFMLADWEMLDPCNVRHAQHAIYIGSQSLPIGCVMVKINRTNGIKQTNLIHSTIIPLHREIPVGHINYF